MCVSFKAYTSRHGYLARPCPTPISQSIRHVFCDAKGGGRDCGMCLSFKAYTSRYGRFCTPCPKSTSQLIHHVFLLCKEAGQCGIYVSFKAYTSRYGYFACLDPNPPANSSIAFFAMQRKVSTAHVRFIQSIYIKVRILGTPCPTPISQSIRHVFWRCKEK